MRNSAPVLSVPTETKRQFSAIAVALVDEQGVTVGSSGKKGFGSSALQVNGKIFAMVSSKGRFVVKLPKQQVEALQTSGIGQRFDPGHGRLMKEWLAMEPGSEKNWSSLARDALRFVGRKS